MQLVLIETAGNQRYVFGTNRLRENIGASEQIFRAGTQWLLDPLHLWSDDTVARSAAILGQAPLGTGSKVEVVYATSGKAVALCDTVATATELIRRVTSRAVTEANGLDIAGCAVAVDWQAGSVVEAYAEAAELLARTRGLLPPTAARSPQLPLLDVSVVDGLPGHREAGRPGGGGTEVISLATDQRRQAARAAIDRLRASLEPGDGTWRLVSTLDRLEQQFDDLSWLAVVHADGNGIGRAFLELADRFGLSGAAGPAANRAYVDALRSFSVGLELVTEQAFRGALAAVADAIRSTASADSSKADDEPPVVPVVPLILGGDDSTFVCEASIAIELSRRFVEAFVRLTAHPDELLALADLPDEGKPVVEALATASDGVGFGMAAGIAAVHAHHPFHAAYELAAQLTASAKVTKRLPSPAGALDFHVLYDTSATDLDVIRDGRRPTGGAAPTRLWGGPYLVDLPDRDGDDPTTTWCRRHDLDRLLQRREALSSASGDRLDRNALLHRLRDSLLDSPERATTVVATYRHAGSSTNEQDDGAGAPPGAWMRALSEDLDPTDEPVLAVVDSGHPAGDEARVSSLLDLIDLEVLR